MDMSVAFTKAHSNRIPDRVLVVRYNNMLIVGVEGNRQRVARRLYGRNRAIPATRICDRRLMLFLDVDDLVPLLPPHLIVVLDASWLVRFRLLYER